MNQPLWTDVYAPSLFDLSQPDVRAYLADATSEPINLVFHGPAGVGKTAAVRALADEAHDDTDNDLVELNVADIFDMTKKEIGNDPRFSHFIDSKRQRNSSKSDLLNHVLKESASYSPVSGTYKTIVLDNAENIREDFQQALRRVMEQHYETTQFIITTQQPSKLIPPLKSRCFPLAFDKPDENAVIEILEDILAEEGVEYDDDALAYLAGYANGNIRKGILATQTIAEQSEDTEITLETANNELGDVGITNELKDMLSHAENGDFNDARDILDDLLIDEGYDGQTILQELVTVAHSGRYTGDELTSFVSAAGDVDMDLTDASSDRIQLSNLLANLPRTTNQFSS